jgi:hypothetical protein
VNSAPTQRPPRSEALPTPQQPPKDAEARDPVEALRMALEPTTMIEALSLVNVDRDLLETATGADARTIRRWTLDENDARPEACDILDRLRIVALYMLQREAMPARFVGKWLKARNLELGIDPQTGVRRPVDAIRDDDLPAIFAAINALIRAPTPEDEGPLDGTPTAPAVEEASLSRST